MDFEVEEDDVKAGPDLILDDFSFGFDFDEEDILSSSYVPIDQNVFTEDSIEIDIALSSSRRGSGTTELRLGVAQQANQLAIETDMDFDIDIVDEELNIGEAPKYELQVTPSEYVVSIYQPRENESYYIDKANEEIHNLKHQPAQYMKQANRMIEEYLDSEKIVAIPVGANFNTPEYRGHQNFKSYLIAQFHNHMQVPELTPARVADSIVEMCKKEIYGFEATDQFRLKVRREVEEFFSFGLSVYNEADRQTALVTYVPNELPVRCPATVGNFVYVCQCGKEYPMENGRPTMTFYLPKGNTPRVMFQPSNVYCDFCKTGLELPKELYDRITESVLHYIKQFKGIDFKQGRYYRPKIADLMEMIPIDAHDLFQLDANVTTAQSVDQVKKASQSFITYQKLITMWMDSEISQNRLERAIESYSEAPQLVPLVKEISKVDFSFVPDIQAYQFTRTLIYFLEQSACFVITKRGQAVLKYFNIQGYRRQAFDTEYALEWIYDNAPFLASLNNMFDGDTEMEDLEILPEYIDAINYVVGLHLLAQPDMLREKSDLARWYKEPSSKQDQLSKIYKTLKVPNHKRLAGSARDVTVKPNMYSQAAWGETFKFLREVVVPLRYSNELSAECKALGREASRGTESDFYGEEIPEDVYVAPSLRFDDFKLAFKELGYKLFTGALVDETRKNLAMGIELFAKAGRLDTVLKHNDKPVNDVSGILISSSNNGEKTVNDMVLELIIKGADLPDDLNEIREEHGYQVILSNFREQYADRFLADKEMMDKYGEVISCYL